MERKTETEICKYEHAKFIIERFDHYFDSINNKGTFYIGLNTFIFGGLCVGYLTLANKVEAGLLIWVLFISVLLANALSIFFTVIALIPFLKESDHDYDERSLIYFGGIATYELPYFKEKFIETSDSRILEDIMQQVHCLSKGLRGKYNKLKRAGWFVVLQFILLLPLLLLITQNLKK